MNLKKTFDTLIKAIRDGVHVEVTRTEYERDRLFIGGKEYPIDSDHNYHVHIQGEWYGDVVTNEDVTADFHIREEN